jgi:hypothetical protein
MEKKIKDQAILVGVDGEKSLDLLRSMQINGVETMATQSKTVHMYTEESRNELFN